MGNNVTDLSSTTPVLSVRDVHTTLQTAKGPLQAVDGVSFDLHAGQTLGIVGESGSGKSVLGRTIMGLITSGGSSRVTGEVLLDGKDVQSMSPRELRQIWGSDIAMVFQDPMTALNPVKRIGTQMLESIRVHQKVSRAEARDRSIEVLTLVGIPEPTRRFDQYPHELSGGMRQRVVIALALLNNPRVLIADEPTTALDVTVQRQILDLLQQLQEELQMATILVSHNLGVVAGRAHRVAVMYGGRFVESGEAQALFSAPEHRYTHALLEAIPKLQDVPHTLLAAIPGTPPDMTNPPTGCRFAPRCQFATKECLIAVPRVDAALTHQSACIHPVN